MSRVTTTRKGADLQERGTSAGHPQARFGNENAMRHGARSASQIKARARAHRRRFLRQAGLRARDLDAIAGAYLDGWARALAKLDAYDSAGLERDPREYHAAMNSARLWLAKLEQRLGAVGLDHPAAGDPFAALAAHLEAKRNGVSE